MSYGSAIIFQVFKLKRGVVSLRATTICVLLSPLLVCRKATSQTLSKSSSSSEFNSDEFLLWVPRHCALTLFFSVEIPWIGFYFTRVSDKSSQFSELAQSLVIFSDQKWLKYEMLIYDLFKLVKAPTPLTVNLQSLSFIMQLL